LISTPPKLILPMPESMLASILLDQALNGGEGHAIGIDDGA
jgi:hypothetical protein